MPQVDTYTVPAVTTTICNMNDKNRDDPTGEKDVDQLLAELEPHERPPKCAWVPPCEPAFGTKSERLRERKVVKGRRLRDCVSHVFTDSSKIKISSLFHFQPDFL